MNTISSLIDADGVGRSISALITPGSVFEIRILNGYTDTPKYTSTYAGYFKNDQQGIAKAIAQLKSFGGFESAYVTAQTVDARLLSRANHKIKKVGAGATTSDRDILSYSNLLIDFDPVRPAKTSSDDESHSLAIDRAYATKKFLASNHFPDPIVADSGNGAHLIYRVSLPNDEEVSKADTGLVYRFLQSIHERFNGNGIDIDLKVFNPSRIWKLYGTRACKGDHCPELGCPWRMSSILELPEAIVELDRSLIEEIAKPIPKEIAKASGRVPAFSNGHMPVMKEKIAFLEAFVAKHGIKVRSSGTYKDGVRYVLEECAWDSSHKAPDACIYAYQNGYAATCSHNSCAGKGWKDFRAVFEPGVNGQASQPKPNQTKEKKEKVSLDMIAVDFVMMYGNDWGFEPISGTWYQWTGKFWQDMHESEGQRKSCVSLDGIVRDLMLSRDMPVNKSADLDCVVRLAAIDCKRVFAQKPGLVNFSNGTLDTNSDELRAHSKADEIIYCLPYDYDEHGEWYEIMLFLQQMFPDKYASVAFMCHVGLALMRDNRVHQAGAIIGDPRTGKSTALDLALMTCGQKPRSYADKFILDPDLEGKRCRFIHNKNLICCADELPSAALRNEEIFKTMTAHGGVGMRGMCRDDEKDNGWKPKFLMAMNDRPEYKDNSGALRERLVPLMVSSTRARDARNVNIIDDFAPELGGFAASCIRMGKEALKRGYYPLSCKMKLIIGELAIANNTLKAFIEEECFLGADEEIFSQDLYQAYEEFCRMTGHEKLASNKMTNLLCQMKYGIEAHASKMNSYTGKKGRYLTGIRKRSAQDVQIAPISPDDNSDLPLASIQIDPMCQALWVDESNDNGSF